MPCAPVPGPCAPFQDEGILPLERVPRLTVTQRDIQLPQVQERTMSTFGSGAILSHMFGVASVVLYRDQEYNMYAQVLRPWYAGK